MTDTDKMRWLKGDRLTAVNALRRVRAPAVPETAAGDSDEQRDRLAAAVLLEAGDWIAAVDAAAAALDADPYSEAALRALMRGYVAGGQAAAALAARTYATLSVANLGPAPRHTVLLSLGPRDNLGLSDRQAASFNQQVFSRLERLPGTGSVALADLFPPVGFPISFQKQGDSNGVEREATWPMSVSPGYFRTLGIRILLGRNFEDSDNSGGEPVAIISLDMAERNWTSPERAVGSQIAFGPKFQNNYTIVGVAANFTGVAISYAIGQASPMVAALWGVFAWREFRGAGPRAKAYLALMVLFYLLAIVTVAGANRAA